MKKVSVEKEAAIIQGLIRDIKKRPKQASALNQIAIKKLYKKEEKCLCGMEFSMLGIKGRGAYSETAGNGRREKI